MTTIDVSAAAAREPYPTREPCPLCGLRRCVDYWLVRVRIEHELPGVWRLRRAGLWDDADLCDPAEVGSGHQPEPDESGAS